MAHIAPDTNWHELTLTVDTAHRTASMKIDDRDLPVGLLGVPKEFTAWLTQARLQVELQSIYPGTAGVRLENRIEVRDWRWLWQEHTPTAPTPTRQPSATNIAHPTMSDTPTPPPTLTATVQLSATPTLRRGASRTPTPTSLETAPPSGSSEPTKLVVFVPMCEKSLSTEHARRP